MNETTIPRVQVILPRTDQPQILMQATANGWTLPEVTVEPDYVSDWTIYQYVMDLNTVVDCAVTILRTLHYETTPVIRGVFVAENRDPDYQPGEGFRWMGRDDLRDAALVSDDLRALIDHYFHEIHAGVVPAGRPPWAKRGWLDSAYQWIHEQLDSHQLRLTGEIVQIKKWCITCMLRIPTTQGDLYFKAVPPLFAREVHVTRYLSQKYPNNLPEIVAYHEAES